MGLAVSVAGFILVFISIPLSYALHRWRQGENAESFDQFLGSKTSYFALASIAALWLMPYGLIVLMPLMFILSFSSPAGRIDWKEYRNERLIAVFIVFLMLGLSGLMPCDEPRSPEEWGEPFAKENPYAPAWPASEQFTWILVDDLDASNFEVVQSIRIRTPHQFGIFSQVESSVAISSFLGLENERMRQAIDIVDERLTFIRIDSDEFKLEQRGDAQEHTFRPSSGDVKMNVWVYDCLATSGTNSDGTKIGEVVIAGVPGWGGVVDLVVIVRPVFHDGLATDPFAETLVSEWLSS
tara:strand:+ start:3797 stop:4684 length:888 start_codon:yes stop_codon:yes gene_type:complete